MTSASPIPPNLQLRAATVVDVPQILAYISELAEFEELAHEAVATEEVLRDQLFGATPGAEVVMAEVDAAPAGFALFFHSFSTFLGRRGLYLEDLYVRPAFRGRGVGRALMAHLAGIAQARGCGRFEWSVLDWNADAIRFYRSLGARGMDGWTVQRVDGEALRALARSATTAAAE